MRGEFGVYELGKIEMDKVRARMESELKRKEGEEMQFERAFLSSSFHFLFVVISLTSSSTKRYGLAVFSSSLLATNKAELSDVAMEVIHITYYLHAIRQAVSRMIDLYSSAFRSFHQTFSSYSSILAGSLLPFLMYIIFMHHHAHHAHHAHHHHSHHASSWCTSSFTSCTSSCIMMHIMHIIMHIIII